MYKYGRHLSGVGKVLFETKKEGEVTKTTKTMTTVTILTGKNAGKEKRYKNEHFSLLRAGGVATAAAAAQAAAAETAAEEAEEKEPEEADAEESEAAKTRMASMLFGDDAQFSD